MSIGGDGNKSFPFISRPDIARYVSYFLTRLPSEQLKNRFFTTPADNKVVTSNLGILILKWSLIKRDKSIIIVVQRSIQGVRRKGWEEAGGHVQSDM